MSQKFDLDPNSEEAKNVIEELHESKENLINKLGTNGGIFCPCMPFSAPKDSTTVYKSFDLNHLLLFSALKFAVIQCPSGYYDNNLPIGFQVATALFNDNLSIAIELGKLFGGWLDPSVLLSNKLLVHKCRRKFTFL